MKQNFTIERIDGRVINAIHRQPEKGSRVAKAPLIIIVPGFPKNQSKTSDTFGLLADTITKQGYSTLQFDFADCIDNDPQTQKFTLKSAQSDMNTLFEWAKNEGYESLAFIAEGFGAPITFISLPENTRFCILCWPVFDLPYVRTHQFKADDQMAHVKEYGYLKHSGLRVGKDLLDELASFDLIPALNDAYAPTLILHGEQDTVIPTSHLNIAREHLHAPRIDITTFHDGEHGLDSEHHHKAYLHNITEFIRIYALKVTKKRTQSEKTLAQMR